MDKDFFKKNKILKFIFSSLSPFAHLRPDPASSPGLRLCLHICILTASALFSGTAYLLANCERRRRRRRRQHSPRLSSSSSTNVNPDPTSARRRMDDKWLRNRCLLDFQSELETVFCWIPIFCWVYNVEPDSNSLEVHRQLIHNRHPVDVALVGVGLLRPSARW